jgi:hypothetical protein
MSLEGLKTVIAAVVGHQGKRIDEDDFVKYLSYTRNWIPPNQARRLFAACVQAGLLARDGDKYVPTFTYSGAIPLDFRVTESFVEKYTVQEDLFTGLLDHMSRKLGVHRKEVLMEINRIKKKVGYITIEVAALIYCKMVGLGCEEYYAKVKSKLVV